MTKLPQLPTATVGLLFMVLATIILSSMHGMVRYVGEGMHPFVIIFFRSLFGFLFTLPLIIRLGRAGLKTHQPKFLMLRGFTGIIAIVAWFYGLLHVPLAEATALSFTSAIFTALCAFFFLGEIMRVRRWAAIVCGFIGVLVVLRPDAEQFNPAMLIVVCATVFWAISVTLVKHLSKTDSAVSLVGWMSIMLTILSFPLALYYWQWPQGGQWLWLFAIGAAGTLGHLCMVRALKLADTTAVMSIDFFRMVWGTAIGVYFFADTIQVSTWVGAIIIFGSGIYIIFRESLVRENRQAVQPTTE